MALGGRLRRGCEVKLEVARSASEKAACINIVLNDATAWSLG